jgi:hypothetical protein
VNEPEDVGDQLQTALRRLTWATVLVYVVLSAIIVIGYITASHQREALEETAINVNGALCTLRNDLEQRADASQALLEDDGIPGLSETVLRTSIRNLRETVDALNSLDCPAAIE